MTPPPPGAVAPLRVPAHAGRIIDIVAALARGDVRTARCLIANSPGLDWRRHCSPELAGLVDTSKDTS